MLIYLFRLATKWISRCNPLVTDSSVEPARQPSGASPLEGGIPLMVDGRIVGAVGVSGAASEQDAQVAKAGADPPTK